MALPNYPVREFIRTTSRRRERATGVLPVFHQLDEDVLSACYLLLRIPESLPRGRRPLWTLLGMPQGPLKVEFEPASQ